MKFLLLFLMLLTHWSLAIPFPEVVQLADKIVVGTVSAKETMVVKKWEGREVITLVTFTDLEILKGNHEKERLVLEFPGGELSDGTRVTLLGTPEFQLEERVVLFVSKNQNSYSPLVGLYQGLYRLSGDDYDPVVEKHDSSPAVYEELEGYVLDPIDYEYALPVNLRDFESLVNHLKRSE